MSRSARRFALRMLAVGLLLAAAVTAAAQVAPQVTAARVAQQLDAARAALKPRLSAQAPASLQQAAALLDQLDGKIHHDLGDDMSRPLVRLKDSQQVLLLHARAAATLTAGYLEASSHCLAGEDAALIRAYVRSLALVAGVDSGGGLSRLARMTGLSKGGSLAVIDGLRNRAQKPVFALQHGVALANLVIHGANLSDPQCSEPQVSALDADGKPLPTQPTVVGVSPSAIEVHWPDAGALAPATYLLQVVPQKHRLLLGCFKQAPARTAVAVVAAPVFHVAYTLSATCAASADGTSATHRVALAHGDMPALDGFGKTVSARVDTSACPYPVSYAISASVAGRDGAVPAKVGPITQSAEAQISAGLPGGLTLSWNPSMQQLFVSSGSRRCQGIDATALKAAASP